ncbi:OmpA family protein, partial [Bacteroidales bacterium OttesenSCG-928-A17]|nr:OmpA family protein [Bacteroidales bacterium OttesenSCG-928-A17]
NMFNAGLHLDVNVLHLFGARMANNRFKVIVSPAIYAQHFSSKVYTKADDKIFVDNSLSKDLSLGLGGDLALRYAVSPVIDLQLKGTGIWITDNCFDNIKTVGYVKHNAMWGISAGIVWKIGGNRETNLLYKGK